MCHTMNAAYEFERYVANADNMKEVLNEYGVAIVPGVLTNDECFDMFQGMWTYLETITQKWKIPINRQKPETWREMSNLMPHHSMLMQYFMIGHNQASWNVRQNPKIVEIFQKFWGKDDLLVSFDGMSMHMPPEITNRGWYRNNIWLHSDQSYINSDFQCVQSWVTALDVEEGDATLILLEGSHRFHGDFAKTLIPPISKDNWYKLTDEQTGFYIERGCIPMKIKCPRGSLVLWDSRTIHCGVECLKNRAKPKFRAIIYLCYMPREFSSEKEIQKRKKAFEEMRTSTHWPCKYFKLFPKSPRTYGREMPEISDITRPVLTETGMKLVGY